MRRSLRRRNSPHPDHPGDFANGIRIRAENLPLTRGGRPTWRDRDSSASSWAWPSERLQTATSAAQHVPRPWAANVVVPQTRSYATGRRRPCGSGGSAGVVIRDQVATTMMEIRLRNPGPVAQEAELLVPVPDGAVVRGFTFQGRARSPRRGSCRATRRGGPTTASSRRPATPRSSSSPGSTSSAPASSRSSRRDAGGPADLRAPADRGRRPCRLRPAAERVGRIQRPVEDRGQDRVEHADRGGLLAEPPVRTSRPRPSVADVELAAGAATEPGPFRLSFLRERAGVSASLFAYPDPQGRRRLLPAPGGPAPAADGQGRRDPPRGHAGHRPLGQHARGEARRRSARPPCRSSPGSTTARRST